MNARAYNCILYVDNTRSFIFIIDSLICLQSIIYSNLCLFFLINSIGFAIAQRLASEGAKVVVSSRNAENVDRAVYQLNNEGYSNVIGVKCHVGNADDRENLFAEAVKHFGGVDIFVSNAAVNPAKMHVLETSERAWDKIFDVNLKASFLLSQKARQLMLQRGGGSIVYVSSIAAFYQIPVILNLF